MAELAERAGTPISTLRYYVQQRLLRPIERRGTATRYERRELLRLLGFLRLKGDDTATLAEKKKNFESMGDEKLEEWLRSGPLPAKAAQALGLETASSASAGSLRATIDTTRAPVEHWQRIVLLPGLDLMLRVDAKEAARIVTQQIIEQYVVVTLR